MTGTIVIAATPTPNGDLHVGHMAGPYLAGDIHARSLRAAGRPVTYATCTDDSQSYMISTAAKHGTTPAELCATSTARIQRSVEAMGISLAPMPPIDDAYRQAVLDFVTPLYEEGRFELRTVRMPYAANAGTYLFDGLVKGECPACLTESCGGSCEGCGHPNHFDDLGDPRSVLDPADPVTSREVTVLVLPIENYRQELTAYYAARENTWRQHSRQLIREILARPLPEIPITVPSPGWGIDAPFAETPGQILYPWIEAMPASIYSTWKADGEPEGPVDQAWRAESGNSLVYFHGFDNVYFWGMVDLVMLLAHGDRYLTPDANVCNEFYELENEKFSTSRNHLIRGADLVAEVPRDLVRFYLALTCPEDQRANFTREGLDKVTAQRLRDPWNALADRIDTLVTDPGEELKVTDAGRRRAAVIVERFQACYDLTSFSLTRAADGIITQLARLLTTERAEPGDLLMEVRTFLACAAPILIDVTAEAEARGVELTLDTDAETIDAFLLPRLPGSVRSDRSTR
ncbi:class I tRNA ligase family protein [Streptosporangium subroseum]|uniref:class I tRNA ligase family protein n=1 Tax=Streptosporangium subroseum TaxID=106412 RepID=UPI003092D780|nr:class I tRNA ligase family protein [Streptosporangium subroseum]